MHMIDPELAKNAVGQLKSLSENKKLTEVQRRRFKSEYVEALAAKTSFEVGGRYEKASEIWAETSKFYWESLELAVWHNSKSKAEFAQIREGLNKKYIQQYFIRRPTREVAEFLNKDHSAIQKMAKEGNSLFAKTLEGINNPQQLVKAIFENTSTTNVAVGMSREIAKTKAKELDPILRAEKDTPYPVELKTLDDGKHGVLQHYRSVNINE